ncbi:hypothetical protein SAMN05661096_01082 [Marivirga sericea]|uniref:Uncharacterized protein n=1 Tax=Marivirga sericea TaxID=1028 RepID=A0A1X7IYT0_9BACT|nr:hypothetical protein [Marivirga sericea]SMG20171.1 hypothetical protein SAMN05661096_01082 [Marivirga sericea]
MKKFILLFLIINVACSVNTSEKVELEKLRFNYSDDAYIFFRNMRQTNYDLEVMEEGGWRIYRHEDRQTDTTDFYFTISLVVNWRVNRVYPIIEMPKTIAKDEFTVLWEAIESEDQGKIALSGQKRKDEMRFSTELYNRLTDEVALYVNTKNGKLPLFRTTAHKEAFRVTMYDFYRMTGLL